MTTVQNNDRPLRVDAWLDISSLASYLSLAAFRKALGASAMNATTVATPRAFFGSPKTDPVSVSQAAAIGISVANDLPNVTGRRGQLLIAGLDEGSRGADTQVLKVTEAIMRSYFELGLDIDSDETLIAIAQDFGVSGTAARDALQSPLAEAQVDDGYSLALHMGAQSAPFFIFGEAFVLEQMTEPAFAAAFKTFEENLND